MKKLILPMIMATSVFVLMNCAHVAAEDKEIIPMETIAPFPFDVNENKTEITLVALEETYETIAVEEIKEPVTKYAVREAAIYDYPILNEVYIHDYSLVNTSFEVVEECKDWNKITTSDGFAYIRSEDLSIEPVKTYTEEELYIMAHLLAGECQGYPDDEQKRVGSVALNRVNHDRYPDTLKEVVFQPGQYACTWDGNYYKEPTERNWENAEWLLENGSIFPDHVIFQAGFKQGKGVYYKSDWHYFCY